MTKLTPNLFIGDEAIFDGFKSHHISTIINDDIDVVVEFYDSKVYVFSGDDREGTEVETIEDLEQFGIKPKKS